MAIVIPLHLTQASGEEWDVMAGTWTGLVNQPTFRISTMMLLSDGRVMVQEEATEHWYALTPDATGSYVDGTWSPLADMSFWRRYYASGVTRDARVLVIGGEQSGAGGNTNMGEIYDPVSDTWSPIPSPPGWAQVGDAACCLFPDGRLMIGALLTADCAIYDPATNSWSPAASKAVRSNEETWILLADESILTVQCFAPFESERYSISSNAWKNEGKPPVTLVDPVMHEIGPAMLLYNGEVIYFGSANSHGHGKTALYTPPANPGGTGTWTAGPDIPRIGRQVIVCNDCPASLLPNGKVLFSSAPYQLNNWGSPIYFFEYDPFTNTISQAPTPPNNAEQLFWSRMMLLPTGQVLFSPSSDNVQCYTPDGGPREAWRPTICEVTAHCTSSGIDFYLLRGTQLNGLSQANIYGDDCYPATNYPLVRLRSTSTDQVYFCRTYDFSTMAVATGTLVESVRFNVGNVPYGDYELCVIANGISSHCISFCHHHPGRPCGCGKTEGCCHRCEETCCHERAVDPQVIRLKEELGALQANVRRLGSLTAGEPPARQPKERREATKADKEAAELEAAEEKPPRRRSGKAN
jgi:Kelch motif